MDFVLSPPPFAKWYLLACFRHYEILAKLVVEWRRLSRFPAKMTGSRASTT